MKLLVTGSLGLLGSSCMELFKEKGWEVHGIDNNGRAGFFGTKPQKGDDTQEMNICNEVAVNKLFEELKPDAIIHAAAQPSHDYATDHVLEDFLVNAFGTVILLEAARKYCPESPFIYVSTDKVYGENMDRTDLEKTLWPLNEEETRYHSGSPFTENLGLDFAGDRSFFGCSKASADMYAQQYAARFGMKIGIFRPGCITGKKHQGAEYHGFLAYLATCIKEAKTYTIYGNGKQVRDQIHARDVARAFDCFIQNPRSGAVYNIGGGPERSVSVLEAGVLLSESIGKDFLAKVTKPRKGDRLWDVHDVSKFRKDYPNWDYTYSLQDIIKDLV